MKHNFYFQKGLMKTLFTFSILIATMLTNAQNVDIGNNATNNNRAPYGCYNGYEYNEFLFLGSEFGNVFDPQPIYQIGFQVYVNGGNLPQIPVTIKLKSVPNSTVTLSPASNYATASSGATTVFSGIISNNNIVAAGSYVMVTLTTPFSFSKGSNNLQVFIETAYGGTGGADSTSTAFRYTFSPLGGGNSTAKCQRWFSDNAPPSGTGLLHGQRNNVRFVFPLAACTGTPSPGITKVTKNPVCSGTNFTLSLTNFTNATGVTYEWQSSATGTSGPFTPVSGATGPTFTTSQTVNTAYRCRVICGANSGFSGPLLVTTNIDACYCVSVYNDACAFGDEINAVRLGTLDSIQPDNTCPSCNCPGPYSYFSGISPPTLYKSSKNTLFVTVGDDQFQYVGAWIDYNRDGAFAASEFLNGSANVGSGGTAFLTFTVPAGAVTGTTRLRIRGGSDTPVTSGDMCGRTSSVAGETEDYNVNIQVAPACSGVPAGGTAYSDLTSTCVGGTVNVALNGHSTDAGVTYQWQESSNVGGPFTNIAGKTDPFFTSSPITIDTYFRCLVICSNTNDSAYSTTVQIIASAPPSAGVASGPSMSAPGLITYTLTGNTGAIQWQLGFSPNGPFSDIGGATSNPQDLPFSVTSVYYLRNRTNSPGCGTVYSNVVKTIIAYPLYDACNPTLLSFGTNGPYSNGGDSAAWSNINEIHPHGGGCNTQSTWCSTDSLVQHSMWFSFVAPNSGRVEVKALGFNTQIAVYSFTACETAATYTMLSANDDGGGAPNLGAVDTAGCLQPGQIYLVQVDGYHNGINPDTGSTTVILTALAALPPSSLSFTGCPSNVTVNSQTGVCGSTVSWTAPTLVGYCGVPTITSNKSPGDLFNIGTTTVTYIGSDATGSTASCSFNVTVVDNIVPSITCPSTVTVNANSGVCFATGVSLGIPTTSDNCGVSTTTNNAPSQFNVGNTNVTWIVTDVNGKTNSCNQTVTVIDDQVPFITCPGNVSANANSGVCFATGVTLGTPTTTDNCGVSATTNNGTSQYSVGSNLVSWTVTDVNGQTNACSQTVTVIDNQSPSITCPANISLNAGAGVCFALSSAIGTPTTTDNCGVASTFNNAPSQISVGSSTVIWTVTDINGRTNTCNQNVTVIDNQVPLITCPGNVSANASSGDCFATGISIGTPTTSDNCAVSTTTNNAPSQFNVGATIVNWTVTDVNGKTNFCNQTVTVVDNQSPLITCPANITVNANSGVCFATGVSLGTPTTSDNCGVSATTNNAPSQISAGNTTVTWVVTDVNGNTNSCTQTITVVDNQAPTITCPVDQTVNADPGVCFATGVSLGTPTTNDNCGVASTSNNAPSQYSIGSNSVVWTVTDNAGNTNSCTQTITVVDNQAPTITCPVDQTVNADPGVCFATGVSLGTPTTNDNCGVASTGNNAPSQYTVGSNSVVWTVTDNSGNTNSCTQTITVVDNQAPTITCPADITVNANTGVCFATGVVLGTPTTNDNCGVASTSNNAPSQYSLGSNSVVWTVTDNAGNTNSCTQTITVVDNQAPTITCPVDQTVNADPGVCFATGVSLGTPTTNDNCGVASTSNNAPSQYSIGSNSVVWTVTDNAGNTNSCTQTITVVDNQAPTITCPVDQTVNADPGVCFATGVSLGTPTTNDNCGVASTSNNAPSQYSIGSNSVVWTVTDNSGNTNSCIQTITVVDNQAPTITCPVDQTVNADPGVCFATGVSLGTPTTNDNCGVASTSNNAPSQYSLGSNSVVWTVTDNSGNTNSCTQTITVVDNQAPTITCPADITVNANTGVCFATGVVLGTATTNDNCGVASTGNNAPSQYAIGSNSVVWTVTDNSGNTNSCIQTITVVDNQAPTITCPVDQTVNADPGVCFATGVVLGTSTTNDNCGVASTSNNAPSQYPVGNSSVVWTVTDNAGNTNSCTQTITVLDNQAPTITCPADITVNANTGVCFATGVVLGTPTTNDNCGVSSTSNNAPSQYSLGSNSVVWTVTDNAGNTNSCTQTITVVDNQAPTITCPVDQTVNADPGVCFATGVSLGTPTTNDNCGVASTGNNAPSQYTVGSNSVVWTVTDNAGNTNSCTQTITVVDNQAPTITCPVDQTVNADPGVCFATGVSLGTPTTNDNCGVASTGNNAPSQYTVGSNSVVWTVTDNSGNTNSCTQTITVVDNQAPTITCPADITVNANTGVCFATSVVLGTPTTNDNCGVASTSNNAPSQYSLGSNSVVWTVTDNAGNTNSCTQTITVIDNQAPTITCPVDQTVNADPGVCFATGVVLGTPTTNDNCGVAATSNNAPSQYSLGSNSVVWTVTDNSGNTNSCTQTITVVDNQAPTINCPAAITISCNITQLPPYASLTDFTNDGGTVNDNCTINANSFTMLSQVTNGNSCPETITRTYQIADASGNTASCAQTIIVHDVTPPVAVCQNINVTLNSLGNASITAAMVNNGSTDNCGIASMNVSPSTFNCFNIGANNVTFVVTDNCGNTNQCTTVVTVVSNISVVMTTVNVSCGTGTGSASATPSGGTPAYSYLWNNSQTNQTATGLLNGTYTVTVTDANGCTKTATAQVIVTPPLVVNCSSSNALCFGTATGSATVVGSAGTPPYQYLWSNGQTNATAVNLLAGTYTVIVTDFSNCTASCSATLGEPAAISITGTVTDNVCKNSATGSVNITATGGSGIFTSYIWSNGTTIEDAQNLAAGVYVVTAADNTGCTKTSSFTVGQPATLLTVNVSKTNVRCGGLATGSATASPTGGTSPYIYVWNNGSTDVTINNLPAGTYTVTVTDAIGCIKTKSLSITQNPPMLVVVAPTSTTTAFASASGGVPPYTYLWKTVPNQTTSTATGLVAGATYKVKVNDSKGCSKITTFVMPIPKAGAQIKNPFTVRIYPNPSDGIVNMIFENAYSNNYRIHLNDLVGKEIFAKEIVVENSTVIFDFSKFPKGIYSLSVDDGESLKVLKVVLQ